MYTILNDRTDPRFNLALEEYVLKDIKSDEDFILLWQNEPSVIIGRNQNTIEEVNDAYIKKHGIHVVRRISGGGAVYHDFGNLNFTFITNTLRDNLNNYKKFTEPVILALNSLGVKAEFAGRNDILVEGKKISGNAQTFYRNRMFHHGTILFDADLDMVTNVLNVKLDKIQSKGIKSIRSRVGNVIDYLRKPMSVGAFKDHLLKYLLQTDNIESKVYTLTDEDIEKIEKLMKEKYSTWEWNFGESPEFDIQKSGRFAGGKLDIRLNVQDGIIRECKIYGDFFGTKDLSGLTNKLIGMRYDENSLSEALHGEFFEDFFFNISKEDFLSCLFH